jgi:outer membrane protein assembly factor BamB
VTAWYRRLTDGKPWMAPTLGTIAVLVVWALLWGVTTFAGDDGGSGVAAGDGSTSTGGDGDGDGDDGDGDGDGGSAAETTTTRPPYDGWVDPQSAGEPWTAAGATREGLLTFRGNPTRTYYGEGPVPEDPVVLWTFPESGGMCGMSSGKQWCGTGWTGQPNVWEQDGKTWVAFGAYDKAVHWLDGATGERLLPDFPVGDIIKGTVTADPDGYPLLYTGSRDNEYRVIAMDRDEPTELWSIHANDVSPTQWNDDWDGSGLVIDDYLFEGGENSQFHIVKLNRGYDAAGKVTVAPELVFNTPGWDAEQLGAIGDDEVSIENSVAISGNTVYFGNSGGLVQGWDISGLKEGRDPERVFRYLVAEDTDASIVVDDEGFLYVSAEWEKHRDRGAETGQLMKLDPTKPDDPEVWHVDLRDDGGIWATPAIGDGVIYTATDSGDIYAFDQATGEQVWTKHLPGPTWQSPVVVDDVLLQGDCDGFLHAYDVSDPMVDPPELWAVEVGGCIESTPAVWKGMIWVGTRGGQFFAIGERPEGYEAPATTEPAASGGGED